MGDLIERLRAIPVWMVEAMAPGWQDHGAAAYEAADEIAALRERAAAADKALYDGLVKASGARGLRISRLTDAITAARAHLLNPESDNAGI